MIKVVVVVLSLSSFHSDATSTGEKQVPGSILQVPSGSFVEEIITRLDQQQEVIELQTKYIEKLAEKVKLLEEKVTVLENR